MKIQRNTGLFALILTILFHVSIFAQTGATYDLSHHVIAGGGEKSTSALYKLEGTIGQTSAGTVSSEVTASPGASQYSLRGGFWAFESLAPTAAAVTLSGRILAAEGGAVRRVRVALIDTLTGSSRTTEINPFGFYSFEEVEVGRFYIVRAESLDFTFTPPSYAFVLMDERNDVDFTGQRVR
jgi:hypothetical protein